MAKVINLGLFCVQVIKPTPGGEKPEEIREVYIVADSAEHAMLQLDAVRNDGCTFQCDPLESTLVQFGPHDPKKSKIYH